MAFIDCHFFSETLGQQASMYVLIPQRTPARRLRADREGRLPVLTLLHGMSDDHTIWLRRTAVESYADAKGIAVVMPAAGRSYFQDMAHGPRYWTFIADEVPRVGRELFPLSAERGMNFVAGLSMGGYGAFRLALARPDSYAAGASFSGALDLAATHGRSVKNGGGPFAAEFRGVFGDARSVRGSDSDLFMLARRLARSGRRKPRLYQYCGRNDFLYRDNLKFRDMLGKLKWDLTYVEDDGDHSWTYGDQQVRLAMDWLPEPE